VSRNLASGTAKYFCEEGLPDATDQPEKARVDWRFLVFGLEVDDCRSALGSGCHGLLRVPTLICC
jgi:hypothetical protein